VIKNNPDYDEALLTLFELTISEMKECSHWTKAQLVSLFHKMIPAFGHKETGKYLDGKM
jgi:hypothetical protein